MAIHFSLIIVISLLAGFEARSIVSSSRNEAEDEKFVGGSTRQFSQFQQFAADAEDYTKNFTNSDGELVETAATRDTNFLRRFVAIQGLNLEKILAEFAARTDDLKEYEERAAQWLKLLKEMLRSSSSVKNIDNPRQTETGIAEISGLQTLLIDGDKKRFSNGGYDWLDELFQFLDEQDVDVQITEKNRNHVKSRYDNSSALIPLMNKKIDETQNEIFPLEPQGFEDLDKMLVDVESQIQKFRKAFEKTCSKHHLMSSTKWQIHDNHEDGASNDVHAKDQ